MAQLIEMPFGLRTRVGSRNHVLDRCPDPDGKEKFWGEKGEPIVKYRDTLCWALQKRLNQSRCCLGCGLGWTQGIVWDGVQISPLEGAILEGKVWPIVKFRDTLLWAVQKRLNDPDAIWVMDADGPNEACIRWGQIPHVKGQLLGKRTCLGMPDDTLPWAVQKWLNWSICCLSCGLGWAEGSTSSILFARCRHVPSWEGTLAIPGEYDRTVRLRQRYGFMSQRAKKEPQYRASKKSSKTSLMSWHSRDAHIQASLIMAALCNRAGHYCHVTPAILSRDSVARQSRRCDMALIFSSCSFFFLSYFLSFFFPSCYM